MMLTIVKLVPKYRLTVESVVIGFQRSMNRSCVLICGIHLFYFRVIDNTGISYCIGAPVIGERTNACTVVFLYE